MATKIFQNKVAIITGSSKGIGKATAIELVKNGASVVLNGRNKESLINTENEIKALGGKAISVCCDVSIPEQAKNLVERTLEVFGKIDILINNAGVSMRGNFVDLEPAVYEKVFDINVLGSVNPSIYALPHIKKSNGSLIFISSLAGIRGLPANSAYSSSKMALRAIAESIRIEEAKSNIHVGLILVGITEIEKGKTSISADGSLMVLKDRSNLKVQSNSSVAKAILKNIRKRKFITTLTGIGKLNAFMQPIMPGVVEKILILSAKRIQKHNE